jgi:hypothetical protein
VAIGKPPVEDRIIHEGKEYVSYKIACKVLLCSKGMLTNFVQEGMPRKKIGNAYYYCLEDCHKWFRGEAVHG